LTPLIDQVVCGDFAGLVAAATPERPGAAMEVRHSADAKQFDRMLRAVCRVRYE